MVWAGALLYGLFLSLQMAYGIRLQAIEEYGPVIHEFDPYFNYRATEYLWAHGSEKFFKWFDYKVWYPLGRPVGTTIYPGMQFMAVFIKKMIVGDRMSLNDVCCYMPAWFGALASFLIGCLTYEVSLPSNTGLTLPGTLIDAVMGKRTVGTTGSGTRTGFGLHSPALECGVCATAMMAIVPAHLMRSVGGGYDNESVAISAMSLTFLCWIRSLRSGDARSWIWGLIAGVAYFNMVAAWGGYVFVLNLIGVHAGLLVLMGRFSTQVYVSYSLFYTVGTCLATTVPVVGWAPIKSLEQLGPMAMFLGYQALQFCEILRVRRKLSRKESFILRIRVFLVSVTLCLLFIAAVVPQGYFGPISSRVRGLFVKHTKTGNPLVDSVAEHQPASNQAYFQYLHHLCILAPIGFAIVCMNFGDSPSFLLVYGFAAYFFSHKMVRLVLLTAPIASALGGIAMGRIVAWSVKMIWGGAGAEEGGGMDKKKSKKSLGGTENGASKGGGKKKKKSDQVTSSKSSLAGFVALQDGVSSAASSKEGILVKRTVAVSSLIALCVTAKTFHTYSVRISQGLSNPTIIIKGKLKSGETVFVDDYREAYWWLRDNTPEDSRILAWWDYGYQITAIANRTTIADGNTWNHEHIALLGKILTGPIDESYEIARHMADFILIWGGGGGDDLAKSPHLARIANSVYRDHCPDDPTCRAFGMIDRQGTPSPMMRESLLYNLHGHQIKTGVEADEDKFKEVYRSKYGKVRIYQILGISEESRKWVADPVNRVCDVPGSWYCPGQYPPGMRAILGEKKDFAQLEDFNKRGKGGDTDTEYQKKYFEHLADPNKARRQVGTTMSKEEQRPTPSQGNMQGQDFGGQDGQTGQRQSMEGVAKAAGGELPPVESPKPSQEEINAVYNMWEDTVETTLMWKIVSSNSIAELENWLNVNPLIAFIRSSDGRGPMWWAFEHRNQDIVKLLMKHGVSHTDQDKFGKTPVILLDSA